MNRCTISFSRDKVIDEILIGRNVFAQDETDCALNVGSGDDPLVMIGFGEEVDDVTMAVNDYLCRASLRFGR